MRKKIFYICLVTLILGIESLSQTIPRDANITQGEYFINSDPGTGNGIQISINTPSTLISFSIPSSVQPKDIIYLRFKDSNQKWSKPRPILFTGIGFGRDANINQGEYFIGNDSGHGNGIPITITPSTLVSLNIPSLTLQKGQKFSVRVKDTEKRWSETRAFSYIGYGGERDAQITSAWYNIDNDTTQPIQITHGKIIDINLLNINLQRNSVFSLYLNDAENRASPIRKTRYIHHIRSGEIVLGNPFKGPYASRIVMSAMVPPFDEPIEQIQGTLPSWNSQDTIWVRSQASSYLFSLPSIAINPAPELISLSPNQIVAGSDGFTLRVLGTNFTNGSIVRWNGSDRITNFVSSTELNISVPTSEIATGGLVEVTVFNSAPGGGISDSSILTINNPVPTLLAINPIKARRGETLSVGIKGSNFINGVTSINLGTGIALNYTTINASDTLTANITIGSNATIGTRNVSATNISPGGGTTTLNNAFTVLGSLVSITPRMLSFGNVKLGQFKDTIITITNTGNDTLNISNIAPSNATFTARPITGKLTPSQSLNDTLRFTPALLGPISGSILVHSNATFSPDTIKVSGYGFGIPAIQLSTDSVYFGEVRINQTKDTIITITNSGNDTLKISNITSSNAAFTALQKTKNLLPSQSFIDTLRFAPMDTSITSATLFVYSNALSSPDSIRVYGTVITSVRNIKSDIPEIYSLHQNYPNPFNPSTTIKYALPQSSHINLSVFNTLGQRVALLVDGKQEAGYHEAEFVGSNLPSGMYFYRLQATDPSTSSGYSFTQTKKLILMK